MLAESCAIEDTHDSNYNRRGSTDLSAPPVILESAPLMVPAAMLSKVEEHRLAYPEAEQDLIQAYREVRAEYVLPISEFYPALA